MKQYDKGYLDSFKETIRFLNKRLLKYRHKEKKQMEENGCVEITLLIKKAELKQIRRIFMKNYEKLERKVN